MDRLVPFEQLQDDYYVGDTITDGGGHADSDEESSDDEVQTALKQIAGLGPDHNCLGEKTRGKTEFEQEMDDELDDRMSDYVRATMRGEADKGGEGEPKKERAEAMEEDDADMPALEDQSEGEGEAMVTSPIKSALRSQKRRTSEKVKKEEEGDVAMEEEAEEKKKVKFAEPELPPKVKKGEDEVIKEEEYSSSSSEEEDDDDEEDDNPIRVAARAARKTAKEARKKEASSKELPDFYNPSEDDDNEEWVQKRRRSSQGKKEEGSRKVNPKQIRLEDGSDAVLSCPGCMVLLTRDCQRHEIYKEQYRAMFVENCRVDEEEQLTIEKTGKEKRKERQKRRKEGGPAGNGEDDNFKAVRCAVCTTKVAVIDHDEVYHFFNVLTGYS